jgi:HSP20 family protein
MYEFRPRRVYSAEYPGEVSTGDLFPKVEIVQEKGLYKLMAEVPGLDKDDIRIHVSERTLTLTGERKAPALEELGGCTCTERYYGCFERSFHLPSSARIEEIRATLDKGILLITMPFSESEELSRGIDILVQ